MLPLSIHVPAGAGRLTVRVWDRFGDLVATPVDHQDSSLLGNLAAARTLVIRSPFAPAAPAGSPCTILRLPT